MDFLWIVFVSLYLATFYPFVFTNPCTNYTTLSGEVKRSSNYILPTDSTAICDSFLEETFYRINSTVGNDIVQTWQSMTHCGTVYPLWMNGTLPLVSDGEVDRVVCQSGISGCCETSLTIKLRNCGTFYVYFLRKPSGCPVSYCFGTQPINSTDVTTSSLQTTDVTTSSLQTTDETTIHTTDAYNTDSTPSTTKPNESSKSILNDVEIIGIVLGVVFGVLLPGIIIVLYSSHQKKKSRVWPSDGYQLNDVENQLSLNTTSEIQNPDLEQTPAWEDSTKSEIVNPDAEQHPDRGDSITSENPDLVQNKDREETVLSIKGVSPSLFPTIKPSRKRIRN